MSVVTRLVMRRWARTGHTLLGQLVIGVLFLIFTIQVITHRQRTHESAVEEELRNLGNNENPKTGVFPGAFPPPRNAPLPEQELSRGPHGDWVEAKGSNREYFLYSAYLDRRGANSFVTIVAIVKRRKKVPACLVWDGNSPSQVNARTKVIHENWNLVYSAALILCSVPRDSTPTHVALMGHPETPLPVQDLAARGQEGRMSVCVKPLHYEYDRALWLVEFIEFYRVLGADRFIFYNHTMGPNIEAVVRHYMEEGVVTLLPWALPVITQKEIRTEGIFAALNDCNLRSVNRFTFSAMVDFDEFLIPRQHDTLLDLLASYGAKDSAYVFQNVFFYLYWENDTATVYERLTKEGVAPYLGAGEPYLLTAFKTRRLDMSHKHGVRSKYVVRPEKVMELGNHQVWEYIGPKAMRRVSPKEGLSHHYRICEYGGFDCTKHDSHVDRTAHTWLARVYQRVVDQCSKIFPSEGFCPTAPPLGSPW